MLVGYGRSGQCLMHLNVSHFVQQHHGVTKAIVQQPAAQLASRTPVDAHMETSLCSDNPHPGELCRGSAASPLITLLHHPLCPAAQDQRTNLPRTCTGLGVHRQRSGSCPPGRLSIDRF